MVKGLLLKQLISEFAFITHGKCDSNGNYYKIAEKLKTFRKKKAQPAEFAVLDRSRFPKVFGCLALQPRVTKVVFR